MKRKEYGRWLQEQLGCKVQKLSVDAGFTCPNRDGSKGTGGCIFCNNRTFTPRYCDRQLSVTRQLADGKRFYAEKYPQMKYLAYFQSYSNTYAELSHLKQLYEEALAVEDVVGLVIGTRPDCISEPLLDYLQELSRRTFVMVEYGIESASDDTLRRIRRGHDFACSRQAVMLTAERGIPVGGHVILGFPWESREEVLRQAELIADLPLTTLKLHQLQVLRGTELARQYEEAPWPLPTAEEYIRLALDYVRRLPQDIIVERLASQSPPDMVIAPRWGLKSHEFAALVEKVSRADQ